MHEHTWPDTRCKGNRESLDRIKLVVLFGRVSGTQQTLTAYLGNDRPAHLIAMVIAVLTADALVDRQVALID